jgi:hypothetical protein
VSYYIFSKSKSLLIKTGRQTQDFLVKVIRLKLDVGSMLKKKSLKPAHVTSPLGYD